MSKYYAGIGSRETPEEVLKVMLKIAMGLCIEGYTLRSGGADGADTAFEKGSFRNEIFRPSDATTDAIKMAGKYHPNWPACKPYVRSLHARNCQIILGRSVKEDPVPVECVICWTPGGRVTGGTGQALRMANHLGIRVINLGNDGPLYKEWAEAQLCKMYDYVSGEEL